jgi:hypothetical protein
MLKWSTSNPRTKSLIGPRSSASAGLEYKIQVRLKIKQLLDCPLQSRKLFVKLKWGRAAVWGVRDEYTETKPCVNRAVEWNQTFNHDCSVYLDGQTLPEDAAKRDKFLEKQPASARLRMSLRMDSQKSFGKHNRYAFVDVNLVEWALAYSDGRTHSHRLLLYGTNSTSYLEIEVTIIWLNAAPQSPAPSPSLKHDENTPADKIIRLSSNMSNMEDCAETLPYQQNMQPHSTNPHSFPFHGNEEEQELNDAQLKFLLGGASRMVMGFGGSEDKVSAAIASTHMPQEDAIALIDDIFKRTMARSAEQLRDNNNATPGTTTNMQPTSIMTRFRI